MKTLKIIISLVLCIFFISTISIAMEFGTSKEAKQMLQKAVKAIKTDKSKAINDFNNGSPIFKQKDLYVFCFDAETGEILAHGAKSSIVGKNVKSFKDKNGFAHGMALFSNAKEGQYRTVDYMWPRPGEAESSPKSSYVTKVAGIGCGVGYYK